VIKIDIKIVNRSIDSLEIQIFEEGHTLCTNLKQILFEDSATVFAGYMIKHPLMAEPRLYIKTNELKTPKQALIDACKTLAERCNNFKEKLDNAISEL